MGIDEFVGSIESVPSSDTELKDESGPCLSTDLSGSGAESEDQIKMIKVVSKPPETVQLKNGSRTIRVALNPKVNTALFALINMGLHQPSLQTLLQMMNLGKSKFQKTYAQNHCSKCGCDIPKGKAGRDCKPCRGIPLSMAEQAVEDEKAEAAARHAEAIIKERKMFNYEVKEINEPTPGPTYQTDGVGPTDVGSGSADVCGRDDLSVGKHEHRSDTCGETETA